MLPSLLGYQLRLAQLAVFRDFKASVGAFGFSPGRVGLLLLIEANAGMSQSRLAAAVGLDRSTMVPVLDDLEQRGLVARRAGRDRRSNGLWLTPAGATLIERIKISVRAHERRVVAGLSAAERHTLIGLLGRLGTEAADNA